MNQFSNMRGVAEAVRRSMVNLVPPPEMLPSEWAEANINIAVGNAVPGPIRFMSAPYQKGMLDAMKEPGINRISLKLGAQLGKTTILQCAMGYHIAHDPKSMIAVQPTEGDMRTFLETKLRPMFEANPSISKKMAKQRGRDGVNNSRIISYVGGWLMLSWAQSPRTLRGRSAPVLLADEIDGYPAGSENGEGDPVQLLLQRNATFGDQRLLIESSTPTIKGASRIDAGFEQGDKRRFWVPCPHCGDHQVLRWENVTWVGRDNPEAEQLPESAAYACSSCGSLWTDGERISSIRKGEWRAEKPFRGHASFHAPELCSTFRRLQDIVQSYLDKIAVGDEQSFVNVSLAEVYEETGETVDPEGLISRREEYIAPVPAGGLVLTAGVDMQQDRLECEIVAWGHGEESWSVDFMVFWGDPLQSDVWEELEEHLSGTWLHESGAQLSLSGACIDTGGTGGNTQAAYDWLRGKTGRRIFGVKGVPGWGRPIVAAPSRKQSGKTKRKVDLFLVGVDEAKLSVMRRLAVQKPGPGYCHAPIDRDSDWFHQLTAEKLITRYVKGFPVREWHKTRPRNEALDCRVYAYAALKIANPSFRRAAERLGNVLEARKNDALARLPEPEKPKENPQEEKPPTVSETVRKIKRSSTLKKRGNWATNW